MGLLSDLKKLFFGAKSVTKSAGRKAAETGEEWLDKAGETSREMAEKAGKWIESTSRDLQEKGEELVDEAQEWVNRKDKPESDLEEELFQEAEKETAAQPAPEATPPTGDDPDVLELDTSRLKKAEELAEKTGKKILDTAEDIGGRILGTSDKPDPEWLKKAKETAEDVGEKVLEEGSKAWDKAKEAGKGLKERFDQLVDKATEEAEKEKLEEQLRKAKELEEELERKVKSRESAEGESLLKPHDSFFDKAKRFAEGDYRNEGDIRIEKGEKSEKPDTGRVKGFEDLDGDGDEIIDDAILDEEDERTPKKDDE